jgi:hypothetical protein
MKWSLLSRSNFECSYRVQSSDDHGRLGLSDTMTAEDVVADMVSSVVTLTDRHLHENVKSTKPSSESSSSSAQTTSGSRPMKLDIVLRDSVIGLNPKIYLTEVSLYPIQDSLARS